MAVSRTTLRFPLLLLVVLLLAGCGGDAADEAAGSARIEAAAMVDLALFDSLAWESPVEAINRGATVYQYSCAKCHGDNGTGKAGYVLKGRLLQPPDFTAEDWRFGQNLEGLREYIYEGNDKGMPHWGAAGLAPRDIDAVAHYIQRRLWGRL